MIRIRGFFRNDAGYINGHLVSKELEIDETVEFLVDTGASRTTLLDKDAIYLGINYSKLRKSEYNMSGIGGSVDTYVIDDSILLFGDKSIEIPVFVLRHPLESMDKEEKIKILRFPSLVGRDVLHKFKLIFDKEGDELSLENRE